MILVLLVFAVVGYVVMTSKERERHARTALAWLREIREIALRPRPNLERFHQALRERNSYAIATPVLLALNVTVCLLILFGGNASSDPESLISWGSNLGLRTTNSEWWRLVTSMFVHRSIFQLLVNVAALWQLGTILERLVGRSAFVAVYMAAGVFAGLESLSTSSVVETFGASGAIFGLYGLLLASSAWSVLPRSSVTIPLTAVKRLVPVTVLFVSYNLANDSLRGAEEFTGLVVGFLGGIVLTKSISHHVPPRRAVATAVATAAIVAVASAVPLRGVTDVRPEIEQVVALEDRTARDYRAAVERLPKRQITTEALARMIDQSITPELKAADARLKSLERVPPEHQHFVTDAQEYLRLRIESWRLRAEGWRKTAGPSRLEPTLGQWESDAADRLRIQARYRANMLTLGKAEGAERASLEAFQKIKPAN